MLGFFEKELNNKGYDMFNPLSTVNSNVVNIYDNIGKDLDEYDLSSYIDKSEAGVYLKNIPGINDLIMLVDSIIGFAKDIIDKIFAFIKKILDLVGKLFTTIEELLSKILDIINSFLSGFGLSIGYRNNLLGAILSNCLDVSSRNNRMNPMGSLLLAAILAMASCTYDSNIFSRLYEAYVGNSDVPKYRSDIDTYNTRLSYIPVTDKVRLASVDVDTARFNLNKVADNEAEIKVLKDTIKSLELTIETLNIDYIKALNGTPGYDIEQLRLEIETLKLSIDNNRLAIDTYIENSTNVTIVDLRDELALLEEDLRIAEEEKSPEYIKVTSDIANTRLLLETELGIINSDFTLLANMYTSILFNTGSVDKDVLVFAVLDLLSTQPGYSSLIGSSKTIINLSAAFNNALTGLATSRQTGLNTFLKDYLSKERNRELLNRLIMSDIGPLISKVLNGGILTYNEIKELLTMDILSSIIPPAYLLDTGTRISRDKLPDNVNVYDSYITSPTTGMVEYDLDKIFTSDVISKIMDIYTAIGVMETADYTLSRDPFIYSVIKYMNRSYAEEPLLTNGEYIVNRCTVMTPNRLLMMI